MAKFINKTGAPVFVACMKTGKTFKSEAEQVIEVDDKLIPLCSQKGLSLITEPAIPEPEPKTSTPAAPAKTVAKARPTARKK
jgi:hypothetical protein